MNVPQANAIANVVIFGLLAYLALRDWWCCWRAGAKWCWILLAIGLIGAYWCGLYIFVVLADPTNYDPIKFGQNFIRPMFTVMGGIMLSASIIGKKRRVCIRKPNDTRTIN